LRPSKEIAGGARNWSQHYKDWALSEIDRLQHRETQLIESNNRFVAKLQAADREIERLNKKLSAALQDLDEARTKCGNLLDAVNAKQAKIDALMLEFLPGEMPAEQRAECGRNQRLAQPPGDGPHYKTIDIVKIKSADEIAVEIMADLHARATSTKSPEPVFADRVLRVMNAITADRGSEETKRAEHE
jgi:chromosome segregation ATPase